MNTENTVMFRADIRRALEAVYDSANVSAAFGITLSNLDKNPPRHELTAAQIIGIYGQGFEQALSLAAQALGVRIENLQEPSPADSPEVHQHPTYLPKP